MTTSTVQSDPYKVFARLRDLIAAAKTCPALWVPACSGEGDRPYTLIRRMNGHAEYLRTDSGRLAHYTLDGAVDRAEQLNTAVV